MKKHLIRITWDNKSSYTGYFTADSISGAVSDARNWAKQHGIISTVKYHSNWLNKRISNNVY